MFLSISRLTATAPSSEGAFKLEKEGDFIFSEEIYAAAVILAGQENDGLPVLCCAAEREFTARLRPNITPEMCRETLITASAMLAVSMLGYVKDGNDDIHSYKAGDVEVRRRENGANARSELQRQAELLMQPYISDGDFCFMGVQG